MNESKPQQLGVLGVIYISIIGLLNAALVVLGFIATFTTHNLKMIINIAMILIWVLVVLGTLGVIYILINCVRAYKKNIIKEVEYV